MLGLEVCPGIHICAYGRVIESRQALDHSFTKALFDVYIPISLGLIIELLAASILIIALLAMLSMYSA